MKDYGPIGLDGVMAKDANEPYHAGDRAAMIKVKHLKSADCVIAGFRYRKGTKIIAAITLGVYGDDGRMDPRQTQARGRGALRLFQQLPLSPRREASALAPRKKAPRACKFDQLETVQSKDKRKLKGIRL